MDSTLRPIDRITSYHAHVYYDPTTTRDQAERLRERVAERFSVRLGRWFDIPIGPHGRAMFQIAFTKPLFPTLVPWLMLNHGDLSVLVHPNTDNQRLDHVQHGLWLGPPVLSTPGACRKARCSTTSRIPTPAQSLHPERTAGGLLGRDGRSGRRLGVAVLRDRQAEVPAQGVVLVVGAEQPAPPAGSARPARGTARSRAAG